MTVKEIIFCCILLGNAVVSALYLVFGLLHVKRCEMKEAAERKKAESAQEEVSANDKPKDAQEEISANDKPKSAQEEISANDKPKNAQEEISANDKPKNAQEETAGKAVEDEEAQEELPMKDEEAQEELPMKDGRIVYVMKFVVMLLCPVAGPIFFGVGHLLFQFIFRQDVHLEDVIFSKERVRTNERADEERERNMAPLEEAIAVSDKESLRSLMLNVIRGDVHNSLAAISLALNSPDSETSHYAASVLQDELNDFRGNVQKVWREIEKEEENQTDCEYYLIPYMNNMLEQKVFTEMEQKNMVKKFAEVGEVLYRKASYRFTSQYYEWICLRLLDIRDFETMEMWCGRAAQQYPEELSSYTCRLKLYFTAQEKEKFFETLDALKQSSIVIDRETLALIRTFS